MQTNLHRKFALALALLMASLFTASPVFADKPGKHAQEWREDGRHGDDGRRDERNHERQADHGRHGAERRDFNGYFNDHQRTVVREYYVERYRVGRCPPGLIKKHHGCQPPRHARAWAKGRPLPTNVAYYALPPRVVVNLGAPPAGHKYVRVASDILLIALGTGMVVDAIQDLDGM